MLDIIHTNFLQIGDYFMSGKRLILSFIAVFIFIFLWSWLWHSVFLGSAYQATASVWRPYAQMNQLSGYMLLGYALFSLVFCLLFIKIHAKGGVKLGLHYGFWIGLLFASTMITWYVVLPIPVSIMIWWMVGSLIELPIAGSILGAIYRK